MHPCKKSAASCAKTLGELIYHQANIQPNSIAYEFINNNLTINSINYSDLYLKARQLAQALKLLQLSKSDCIIILLPPGLDFIIALFGCFLTGVIAVPCYPPANEEFIEKLQWILTDSKPSAIIASDEIIKKLRQMQLLKKITKFKLINKLINQVLPSFRKMHKLTLSNLSWIAVDRLKPLTSTFKLIPPNPDDVALLQYTSGSTQSPKGTMVTHHNFLANIACISREMHVTDSSISGSWLPPYHDMGLISGILTPMFCGIKSILTSPVFFLKSPYRWLQIVSKNGITHTGGPDFFYYYCINKITAKEVKSLDLSRWITAFNGSEPVKHQNIIDFYKKFKTAGFREEAFIICYGLAEATLFVSGTPWSKKYHALSVSKKELTHHHIQLSENKDDETTLISVGTPTITTKIIDPNTRTELPERHIGEIWLQGDSVTKGYWHKDDLTAKTYQATLSNDSDQKYLRSGDLGFMHNQELYIMGRKKDLIIIRGKNYYPHDIETALVRALPNFNRNHIAAFSITGKQSEELTVVCEVSRPAEIQYDISACEKISIEMRKVIGEIYGIYLKNIALVPPKTIKRTTSGKIRRQYLKNLFETHRLPTFYITNHEDTGFVAPQNPIETQLLKLWAEVLNSHSIGINDNFFDLGGESFSVANLSQLIEKEFHVSVPITNLFSLPTIKAQAAFITAGGETEYSPITTLQPHGTKQPIIGVHALGGMSITYKPLSERLGNTQPFYGIDYVDLVFEDKNITVEKLSEIYANAMKKKYRGQSCVLLGHSSGGLVAQQTAFLLRKQNITISAIIMLDSLIQYYMTPEEKLESELATLIHIHDKALIKENLFSAEQIDEYKIKPEVLKEISTEQRCHYIVENLMSLGVQFSEFQLFYTKIRIQDTLYYLKNCDNFLPPLIDVPILYLSSPIPTYQNKATRDWQPFTHQHVDVINTGFHHSMLANPDAAEVVAKYIQDYLVKF